MTLADRRTEQRVHSSQDVETCLGLIAGQPVLESIIDSTILQEQGSVERFQDGPRSDDDFLQLKAFDSFPAGVLDELVENSL